MIGQPMTEITFDLFTSRGLLNRAISDEQRAELAPDKLELLQAVEKAADNLTNVEVQLKQSEDSRKIAHDALREAKAHLATLQPSTVAQLESAERRMQMLPVAERVRLARLPIAPEIQTALADIVEKEDLFEGSRTTCHELQLALTNARGIVAKAVVGWQSSFTPISPGTLIRDHLAAEHKRQLANGGVDQRPQEAEPASPLDAYMKSSRGPLGIRSARQAQRHPDGPSAGPTYPQSMFG